ncbi:hypothetical protein [Ktedonospora formicarum]|uniref:CBM-cenC domain-containing protein n=1 Tax=Ktedonospora formicarum TaxID=2778364 RepID=A0A8J3I0I4_9CHLR|nr:hypothetical protein [Ktedonospora formicarum]GHO47717.1 hypothetical protein KSX_58800 [Ktedonospora formicarum]
MSNTTSTIPTNTCNISATWTQVTARMTANHSYTLALTSHNDNYAGDATYTRFDDINVN